jgi:hypothetical protein
MFDDMEEYFMIAQIMIMYYYMYVCIGILTGKAVDGCGLTSHATSYFHLNNIMTSWQAIFRPPQAPGFEMTEP